MKALSLWQPWASAIALGAKRVETRSWETLYRGPLLIHAAKRRPVYELLALNSNWTWLAVLRPLGKRMGRFGWVLENIRPLAEPIPYRGAQGLFDVPASVLEREAVTA